MSEPASTDITCSFCGRHNREAHMVGGGEDLRICSVCVAKAAAVLDGEVDPAPPPHDFLARWPLNDGSTPPGSPTTSG